MKITEKRLKQIIKEEMERINEDAIKAIRDSNIPDEKQLEIIGLLSSGDEE